LIGNLVILATMHGTELHKVARLCERQERSARDDDLLAPLYAPELVTLATDSMLLRGFQADDDGAHVQEWHCTPLLDA
jgi:hypothetical protein